MRSGGNSIIEAQEELEYCKGMLPRESMFDSLLRIFDFAGGVILGNDQPKIVKRCAGIAAFTGIMINPKAVK